MITRLDASRLQDPRTYYGFFYRDKPCYSYQLDALLMMEWAMLCALHRHRLPYSVDMLLKWARQTGKNETAVRFDVRFMVLIGAAVRNGLFGGETVSAVHAAPGWKPAIAMAKRRLRAGIEIFETFKEKKRFTFDEGYVARIQGMKAIIVYLSANPEAQNKGETASAFMRVDEAQLVDAKEYAEALAPQRAVSAAPCFFQGTGGAEGSLIEQMEDHILLLEDKFKSAGYPVKLLHKLAWEEAARYNESYDRFVRGERDRLGADSLTFITEYEVGRVAPFGQFFTEEEFHKMLGEFSHQAGPKRGVIYVGGVDYCGAGETATDDVLDSERVKKKDSTCAFILECGFREDEDPETGKKTSVPVVREAAMKLWPGQDDVADEVFHYLFRVWGCLYVCEDANGVGDYPSAQHEARRPTQVKRLKMSGPDNNRMGRRLESAVKCGRFHLARDESRVGDEKRLQFRHLQREVLDGGRMRWGHPPRMVHVDGERRAVHDDIPKAAALALEAAYEYHFLWGAREQADPDKDYVPWDEAAGMGEAA